MKMLLLLISVMLSVSGCESTEESQQKERQELDKQLNEIKDFIAEVPCSEDARCNYIAVGSKACGGPKIYLLFSSEVNRPKLEEMVETYNQAEAAFNQKYGIASDCMFVTPPEKVACINGKCEAI